MKNRTIFTTSFYPYINVRHYNILPLHGLRTGSTMSLLPWGKRQHGSHTVASLLW